MTSVLEVLVTFCVTVKVDNVHTKKSHILACINWNEDHPQKFLLGNGIIISAKVYKSFSSASFMPVSCIMTQCAIIDQTFCAEDSVRIALPLKRPSSISLL